MRTTQTHTTVPVATVICVLLGIPKATAHGDSTSLGIPSQMLLLGSVLGLWIVISGGVALVDQILSRILGDQ